MKDKLKKILNFIIKFLKDNKVLLILNILIFVLTVLIHSLYVYKINSLLTYIIMLIYIIVPTVLATIKITVDEAEDSIKAKALEEENVKRHMEGKEVVKVIVIKGKIVNIVVK